MEEQTLHYYLKAFSLIITFLLIFFSSYFLYIVNKNLVLNYNPLVINKGEKIEDILNKNVNNFSKIEIGLIKYYAKIINLINDNYIHYGEFNIKKKSSFIDLLSIISKPSNVFNKITIVEGWSKEKLNLELSKYFDDYYPIPYNNIIAETYFIQKNISFNSFILDLKKFKINYFKKYKNNKLFNNFNVNEIMIIGSLLEKEGLDYDDKRIISSVIINRLSKKMKLQIDATVLFAITNGNFNLQRKLLLSDLKIDHPFNTYVYKGLPPEPISYVGKKTIDILFENYSTDFLFYFFNNSLNRHIFSKTFKEHKRKLNEYRNKK